MNIVAAVVAVLITFVAHFDSFMHIANNTPASETTDMLTAYFYSVFAEEMDGNLGLGMIFGMLCGLPWLFLIRGKRFVTSDIPRVNSKAKFGVLLVLLLCIFGIQGFMYLIQIFLEPLFNQGGGSLTDVLEESTTSLAVTFWGALYIVLIGPVCEELLFRGGVMRHLERYGANFAIVLSSLLFALYHMILFQAAFAFFIGLVLAYTAGRFSLKWAIVLHMINNGLAILPLLVNSELLSMVLTWVYLGSFVAVVIILIWVLSFGRHLLTGQKKAGAPSEPRVFSRAFSSPWLIAYIAATGLVAFSLLGFF